MLGKEWEGKMYVREKDKYEMFLKYEKAKSENEMRKYVNVKKS